MEHEKRNEVIRVKMLEEIEDIEVFIADRPAAELINDRMCQRLS